MKNLGYEENNGMSAILYLSPEIVKKFKTIEYSGGTDVACVCIALRRMLLRTEY